MKFLKRFFESRPLTLPELISLNEKEGLYKGEILQALKDVVLFIGLDSELNKPIKFDDPDLRMRAFTPDGHAWFLLSFVDQTSLIKHDATAFPYMVDFRGISKIMDLPGFFGLIVISGSENVTVLKTDLTK